MTNSNLSPAIDAYGKLIARINELEKQKEAMQAEFKALEEGTYEGDDYVLQIIDSTLSTPDAAFKKEIKAAAEAFRSSKSKQYLTAHLINKPTRTHRSAFKAPRSEDGEEPGI